MLIIPEKVLTALRQVLVSIATHGPNGAELCVSYEHADKYPLQDELGQCLFELCKVGPGHATSCIFLSHALQDIPHGVLCFLPSYALLYKLEQRWKLTGMWARLSKLKKIIVGMNLCA